MDLSNSNGRKCATCGHSREWKGRPGLLWLVCVEPEVWNHFQGPRDVAEIARHSGPCGPDGNKYEHHKAKRTEANHA